MALVFMDGFDCYATGAEAVEGGWVPDSTTTNTIDTAGGRYGGGALKFTSTALLWGRNVPYQAYGGTLIIGFACKHDGVTSTNNLWQLYSDTGSLICRVSHTIAGALSFVPNSGTTLTEAGNSLTGGAWHWVEIKVLFGTTAANGSVTIKVDGTTVITGTSLDTNTTGTGVGRIEFGPAGNSANPAYIDDVVVMNLTGSTMNDFIGDSRINTHTPVADGGVVNWTATGAANDYQCVDDSPNATNGDTDYIASSTVGQESRFDMSNTALTPTTVHAVHLRYRGKKTDAGTRTLRGLINSSSTESVGTEYGLSDGYRWFWGDIFTLDPNGSIPWTEASVNALQVGVEIVQ